ncbi:hypothetical protein B6A27_15825 [Anoxybacillus sp. UARK-01]|nr:hypothetical protein B6A27_15825 [Anoxybacillus sp. UARK-01]
MYFLHFNETSKDNQAIKKVENGFILNIFVFDNKSVQTTKILLLIIKKRTNHPRNEMVFHKK